jgi:predicted ATPase/DNA-binding winged helix-turn-helix (wHTH) protein
MFQHGITDLRYAPTDPFPGSNEPIRTIRASGQISADRRRLKARPTDLGGPGSPGWQSKAAAALQSLGRTAAELAFDGFRLRPTERLLLRNDEPVRLGGRALDLLIALAGRAGEVIGKQELIAAIWPDTFVDEGNLKVHVSALRRALREGEAGRRYISTVAGRGYCFVAPVTPSAVTVSAHPGPMTPRSGAAQRWRSLPALLAPLVGRDAAIDRVVRLSSRQRLVTLVGAGGVGKTSLALAAGEVRAATDPTGISFLDMAAIDDPALVAPAIAAAIGASAGAGCSLSPIGDEQLLLVLDNCEHVVEAVAAAAFRALRAAPSLHILATSREPLRIAGEYIYRLAPLGYPLISAFLSAREALSFPAVQLFVERAARALGEFELRDADVPAVVDLCRKLDGIPLAIEFAAEEAAVFGIGTLASDLDNPLRLPLHSWRTADPRHRSLRASLDWSHRLLTESEQTVFRRLAAFPGSFSLPAAARLAGDAAQADDELLDRTAALVSKSLLILQTDEAEPRFRMSDAVRAYAIEKLAEAGEAAPMARRRAEYCRDALQAA